MIRARTKAALHVKKQRGERVGQIPCGARLGADGRTLVRQEEEQAVLAIIRELRAAGLSLRAVADTLNARGYRVRNGSVWRYQIRAPTGRSLRGYHAAGRHDVSIR